MWGLVLLVWRALGNRVLLSSVLALVYIPTLIFSPFSFTPISILCSIALFGCWNLNPFCLHLLAKEFHPILFKTCSITYKSIFSNICWQPTDESPVACGRCPWVRSEERKSSLRRERHCVQKQDGSSWAAVWPHSQNHFDLFFSV